ncbi:MAG: ATP-binding protein [Acidimicrobiales bacterium]
MRPWPAALLGLVGVAVIELVFGPLDTGAALAAKGLTLVVPVIAAAVLGGRWAAYVVAVAATVAFSLLVPPVGKLQVAVAEDFVALCVFLVVAVVVSTVVAGRIETLAQVEGHRRQLLRSVSHDLRTPLSVIRAASTELREDVGYDEATRDRLLELIGDESERLDRLVSNLLNLSRIDAGALVPDRQPVDVAELVAESERRLARLFVDVAFRADLAPDLPLVNVDFVLMSQVVTNLLENAVRHSPPGGTVTLAAAASGGTLVLDVSDEGEGVDPVVAAEIFEPFRSGPISGTSGIGLAICRAVVLAHGGTITVGDAPPHGARFTIRLPIH